MNRLLLSVNELQVDQRPAVSFELYGGEITGLRGASGMGKTRLLRALADLDPQTGDMQLKGEHLRNTKASDWRAAVTLVPARPRWWLDSAAEHFASDMSQQAKALDITNDRLSADVDELSSGEQSRLALLRALSRNPQILLLDEPTGALDAKSETRVEKLLQSWLNPERAIVWVSHDDDQLERMADQIWTLTSEGLQK